MTWPCSRSQGFTFIEMLIVVLLIAILAGTVVVSLHGRRETHALKVAAKDLAAAIRFAATEARVRQSPHRLAFNEDLRSYRVEVAASGTLSFEPAKGLAGVAKPLVEGVRIASVSPVRGQLGPLPTDLQFNPDGGGFLGWIELQSKNGRSVKIEVMPETGQVHIHE